MSLTIALNVTQLQTLDLSPALAVLETLSDRDTLLQSEQQLSFQIDFPQEQGDPRELSEIPEVRLWFVRLDSQYPWLPFLLNWKAGELARYVAMLVPHQFHRREGIQYNPESLEIFVMHKVFTLARWYRTQGIEGRSRLQNMTQMLGYELEDAFFDLLG